MGWADDQSRIESRKSSSAGVGPLEVVDHHDDRMRLREALEEQPPPGEEVVACQVGVGGAEQLGHARLDEVTVLGAGDQLVQALAQLGAHHVVRHPARRCRSAGARSG